MQHLDNLLEESVAKTDMPLVVAMVGTAAGVTYSGAAGWRGARYRFSSVFIFQGHRDDGGDDAD